jgi:solute carrier family 13 (sodium-dependent dicarboxylate transporter), member 2/3/5
MNWKTLNKDIPWVLLKLLIKGVFFLIGASFTIGRAFDKAKFGDFLANGILGLKVLHPYLLLFLLILFCTFASEFITTIAVIFLLKIKVAAIMMPVLANVSVKLGQNPLFFMFPAVLASAYCFVSPFTVPNSVGYAKKKYTFLDMLSIGFFINIFGVIVIFLSSILLSYPILGVELNVIYFFNIFLRLFLLGQIILFCEKI